MPGIRSVYRTLKYRRLAGKISTVRRIDKVAPPPGKRVVAITFDDGPTIAPARPSQNPITPAILDTLRAYRATATFDVIGTTRFRYPDRPGKKGSPYWNGVRHDHYPEFGLDRLAGVVAQPDLVRRIADEGHEISNHGMTHTAFGPQYYPYMNRMCLSGFDAVMREISELHYLVEKVSGQRMRFARPAHYIDNTSDGFDAYDAYGQMGYLYLGASFDGGGWQASCGDYGKDVDLMVYRLESALAKDASALNGHIIFHKDGYNMSSEAPAVEGLKRQMEVLKAYDYTVVTASRLLSESEFTDIGPSHPTYPAALLLTRQGYPVPFADNRVRPDNLTSINEIAKVLVPVRQVSGEPFWGTPVAEDAYGTSPNQMIVNELAADSNGRVLPLHSGGPVPLRSLAAACRRMVQNAPMPEEDRAGRLRAIAERSEADTVRPATRGQAISLLAAALFGK